MVFSVSIFAQKKIENKVVDASCAMCMFKEKSYPVEGIDKKQFGEMHSENGYCKVIKKANVSGEIRKGKFYATSFKYVEEKK